MRTLLGILAAAFLAIVSMAGAAPAENVDFMSAYTGGMHETDIDGFYRLSMELPAGNLSQQAMNDLDERLDGSNLFHVFTRLFNETTGKIRVKDLVFFGSGYVYEEENRIRIYSDFPVNLTGEIPERIIKVEREDYRAQFSL